MGPDRELNSLLNTISNDERVVILAEAISNVRGGQIIESPDLALAAAESEADLTPDLVVYFGGQVISRRLKKFLRNLTGVDFWYIDNAGTQVDTYKQLTHIIQAHPKHVLTHLSKLERITASNYAFEWEVCKKRVNELSEKYLADAPFSDLTVFKNISSLLNPEDIVFIGNSSAVRYFQLFNCRPGTVYANRGTSGIDGCLSTAAGIAYNTANNVFAILGDLSFVYDSNALWNRKLPQNLKIIVVNNFGGGIFSLLDGPSDYPFFRDYQIAWHPVKIDKLCEAFSVRYLLCNNSETISESLAVLKNETSAALLEIQTPKEINPGIFRNFIKNISFNY
jgi:2-succinyl-5-enolpyruvyl-6-hydroxy-3-cyclohexene-1-carboxylate synthase